MKTIVIAAGGTGGHMFPAQALAESLLSLGWRVILSTDARGARYTGGFPDEVEVEVLPSATFARGGILAKAFVPFRLLAGFLGARGNFKRLKPAVVVGFGGYPSFPAMAGAYSMGLPRILHEQNGVLGRVNQLFAKRVNIVACGTWPTKLPDGVEGQHTGNPVRQAILDRAEAAYIPPGDYPMSILVIGGSQGARILSQVVPAALAMLPDDLKAHLRVSHQARDEDAGAAREIYDTSGLQVEIEPFFADVPARLAECQLVVSRSGASSVADISVIGRPAIFVPLAAAIRDEQTANATASVEAGAAVVIQERELAAEMLAKEVETILRDPQRATAMTQAALSVATPDATERLTALVLSQTEESR